MFYLIIIFLVVVGMEITRDWLVYKHRGRAKPDDQNQENPPVITGPEDASAQRLIDLAQENEEKPSKHE